jgi:TPR repeat protein
MFTRQRKSRLPLVVVFAAVFAVAGSAAEAAKRVALLIGNADYRSANALRNPKNDVELMRATLLAAGFDDVEVAVDASLIDMRKALRNFEDKSEGADVAVLYYSGHGMEMNGQNYLIPVDAVLASDKDVEDETVPLDRAERALSGATKLKLVILDACRTNPFLETMSRSFGTRAIEKGLAKVEPDGADTLVAYASRAGTVALDGTGANSPFAMALSKYVAQPGVDVRIALGQVRDDVFQVTDHKQEPFVYGSLGGAQIYLSIKQLNVTINNNTKTDDKQDEAAPNGISAAAADWNNIKDLADKELLEAFLAKHGSDPVYKMLAEKKLKLLAEAEQKTDTSADQIAWDALKGSTDAAALKRFMERYPDSRYRKDAEQQIASLAPAQSLQTSALKDTPAARDCYLLAGEPQSLQGFAGVYLPKIDAKAALTACAQAVNESPNDGMLVNLLGRAHEADRNYTEAHRNYQKAADLGDMFALTNLGWLSVYGLDGPVDVEKGRQMFEKAANAGNHSGQASLAFLYRDGYGGIQQDYNKAIEWYTKSANQGNAAALGNLGWFYREGQGVTRDYQKSVEYYRKGAEAGDLSSIAAMGYAAQNGLGIPQNYDEAKTWYEKGANAGDSYSMASLGFLYDAGAGVKQDYVEARYWYEKAANAGSPYAMGNLSRLYDQGLGTAVDPQEAVRWAVAAVERGDPGKTQELKTQANNFSIGFRREFQTVLQSRGYFKGTINGDFGPDTIAAIDSLAAGKDANANQTVDNNTNTDQNKTDDQANLNTQDNQNGQTTTNNQNIGAGAYQPNQNNNDNTTNNNNSASTPDNSTQTTIADAITFRPNVKATTATATECYSLAAEPGSEPGSAGVLFADIKIRQAIDVCTRAANETPGDSMLHDMVGRAYDMDHNYEQAKKFYQKSVDLGNAYAYTNMAWLAIYGNGETQDIQKGMRMMEKAANAGNSYAQASLGWVYREGYSGIAQNYQLAFDWYMKAALQDYPNAQASIGWLYREGLGVPKDYAKSLEFYRKGAALGDLNAIGSMGYALQNGLGTPVNFEEARTWYEKGVEKNDPYCLSALAWLYREGKGVNQDYARALELYQRAANLGDVTGMSSLGYMDQYGLGTPVNYPEALRWYEQAAAKNDAYSLSALGWMYREGVGVNRDYVKSLDYYRRGAALNDLNSMGSMGYALQNGLGTPVNFEEARMWYEKGAEGNDAYSMASLAWLYENGKGVKQDYVQAKSWYEKAANAGNSYAMGNLSYLYDKGLGTSPDPRQAARLAIQSMEGGEAPFINDMKAGATTYSQDFRRQVQQALKDRGYYSGPIDGIFGVTTANAIDKLTGSRT